MKKLNILWTTTNRDTITNMIKMYATNAIKKGWWDEINIIIWGGSTQLVGTNKEVQKEVQEMMVQGINVEACLSCAMQYGVDETLTDLGLPLKYMGEPLTEILKTGERLLTL